MQTEYVTGPRPKYGTSVDLYVEKITPRLVLLEKSNEPSNYSSDVDDNSLRDEVRDLFCSSASFIWCIVAYGFCQFRL